MNSNKTVRDALNQLNILAKNAILFITDNDNKLLGALTDGDVRRALLKGFDLDSKAIDICNKSPKFFKIGDKDISNVIRYRENDLIIIPVVDDKNCIVNVVNFYELKSYLPIDAVIMAGGRGERLRPLTDSIPKPLLKVGDKPIIEHNIDRLRLYGVDDFWITLRYLGEKIEKYLGNGNDKGIDIKYLYENMPLGTIGAVSQIKSFKNDYVLIINSDLLTNIDYEKFFLDFLNQKADISVATIPYAVEIPYAVIEIDDRKINSFKEKPTYTYYSNGGIYLLKKDVLEHIPIQKNYNTTDLMEKLIQLGKKVISFTLDGYWLDIGKHEDYEKAQKDIKNINLL